MKLNCKYAERCGGCIGKADYTETIAKKQAWINDLFKDFSVENVVSNYYPFKYRNKIQLAFTELKGKTLIGFFENGSTKVTDINECILNGDWASKLISILREYISRFKIRPYVNGNGVLRYAHARCLDNKLQLTIVVTHTNFSGRDWLYNKLKDNFAEVSFYLNINNRTDRAVFDKQFKFIKGSPELNFEFCGVKVSLTPSSFLQVNRELVQKMYKKALVELDIKEDTVVVDLYSGIGITSIMFSQYAKEVIAIEEVSSAVSNAKKMANLNCVNNIKFMLGKCEDVISKINKQNDMVVFVDPARAGLEKQVITRLKELNPRKIVYMSCNPETCLRDIKELISDNKYVVTSINPFDVFAFTEHCELLTILIRK